MKKKLSLVLFFFACLTFPQPAQSSAIEIGGSTTPPPKSGGPTIVAVQSAAPQP